MTAVLFGGYGFTVENEFKPYEKMTEVKLPFGSCVSESEQEAGTELYNRSLKAINFFRRDAEAFSISDYEVRTKDYIFDWLKKNESKCKVLPRPQSRKVSHGNLGMHTDFWENDYERDAEYGTADILFVFAYNTQYEEFNLHLNIPAFNYNIPEQEELQYRYMREIGEYSFDKKNSEHKKTFDWFVENIFPKCEFIPVEIDEFDGCIVSHKAYRDWYGRYDEVTSPCLGKNIKKHEKTMEKLTRWLKNGGYIKDDKFYLIIEDRKAGDGSYYLRPWTERS